jgi:gas vesicle protein
MSLTPAELQELQELEELEALEQEAASLGGRSLAQAEPKTSKAKSFASGTAQGLTAGHTPQIVGGLATLGGKLQDLIYGEVIDPLTGKAIPRVEYTSARDATVKDINKAATDNPLTSIAGNVAGSMVLGRGASKLMNPAATGMGRIAQATGAGAGQGFLYNPGDKEGVVNPTQLGDRAVGAGIGGLMGGAAGLIGEGIKKGVQVGKDIRALKRGDMATTAKQEIDSAIETFNQKQIAPRDAQLKALITGKQVAVNPDMIDEATPQYADMLRKRGSASQPVGLEVAGAPAPLPPQRVDVEAPRALRLKRALDASNYSKSKPFDPVAMAKDDTNKKAADHLRRQLDNLGPEVNQVNDEMAKKMALRDALAERSRSAPISAISGKEAGDKGQLIKLIDRDAGSSLEALGNRIDTADDLLLDPKNLVKPLQLPSELLKMAQRGGISLSEALSKIPDGTAGALRSSVLETKRRVK